MKPNTNVETSKRHYPFLDEYRGLSVVLMILANYIAFYQTVPAWLKHGKGDGFTLVDLIAPMFLFILGIMFRQSLLNRVAKLGILKASVIMLRRYVLLMAIGFIGGMVAKGGLRYEWGILQAIGLAGVLALPFLFLSWPWRVLAAALLLACYYLGVFPAFSATILHAEHGGPLACIAWAALVIGSTVAGDLFHAKRPAVDLKALIIFCVACGLSAIVLSSLLGLPIDKSAVNPAYIMTSLAYCSLLFVVFYLYGEQAKISIPTLGVLGKNALLLFLMHYVMVKAAHQLTTTSTSSWTVAILALTIYLLCYATAWVLDKKRWYLRL